MPRNFTIAIQEMETGNAIAVQIPEVMIHELQIAVTTGRDEFLGDLDRDDAAEAMQAYKRVIALFKCAAEGKDQNDLLSEIITGD